MKASLALQADLSKSLTKHIQQNRYGSRKITLARRTISSTTEQTTSMIPYEFYFDAIQSHLTRTATWRRSLAARYPGDKRNLKAADELARLTTARFCDVPLDTWERVRPALESEHFREALQTASRDLAFRFHPADIEDFVEAVAKGAYAFAKVAA